MFSENLKCKNVVALHNGEPHIRTEVVFLTPVLEEDLIKLETLMFHKQLKNTLQDMISKVEEEIGDTFEADVESIYVGLRNFPVSRQKDVKE